MMNCNECNSKISVAVYHCKLHLWKYAILSDIPSIQNRKEAQVFCSQKCFESHNLNHHAAVSII